MHLSLETKLYIQAACGRISWEKMYLNVWRSEDTASVQVVWGCWAANLHLMRRREAKTLFWAEKPKGANQPQSIQMRKN